MRHNSCNHRNAVPELMLTQHHAFCPTSYLPPGSEILFRPPTPWEQYKTPILAITGAILVQALLIAWLIHERQYRRRAERTARETFSELAQVNRIETAGELSATIAHEIK